MRFAAQIRSTGSDEAVLSRKGERIVAESLATIDGIELMWLPHYAKVYRGRAGAVVSSTILLIAAGVAFNSLVKPFVDAVAKEAGKDFWSLLKKVLGRTALRQTEETYRVSGKAYALVEQGEDWVAISLPMPTVSRLDDIAPDKSTEKALDKYFASLAAEWDDIQKRVTRIGDTRGFTSKRSMSMVREERADENVVHLIYWTTEGFTIEPVSAKDFFDRPGIPDEHQPLTRRSDSPALPFDDGE
jgi:galactose mutarotase-like enzyme